MRGIICVLLCRKASPLKKLHSEKHSANTFPVLKHQHDAADAQILFVPLKNVHLFNVWHLIVSRTQVYEIYCHGIHKHCHSRGRV